MQIKVFNYLLFFIIFLLSSCYIAPKSIFLLEPINNNGNWFFGKQYSVSSENDIKIALAYDQTINDKYRFKIEVINLSQHPILVSPEKFYYAIKTEISGEMFLEKIFAINPEEEILKINKKESREKANYASTKGNDALISFIDLIVDLSEIGTEKTSIEKLSEENNDLKNEISDLQTDLDYQSTIHSLNRYKSNWEQTALRKTTLPSGFKIMGDIYFPVNNNAEEIEFYIVIEKSKIKFPFKQKIEEVY